MLSFLLPLLFTSFALADLAPVNLCNGAAGCCGTGISFFDISFYNNHHYHPLFNILVFNNHQYDQNKQGCILTKKYYQNQQGCIITKKQKKTGMHTPDVNGEYTGGSGDHEYLFFEQFWSNGAGVFDLLRPGLKSINPGQIAVNWSKLDFEPFFRGSSCTFWEVICLTAVHLAKRQILWQKKVVKASFDFCWPFQPIHRNSNLGLLESVLPGGWNIFSNYVIFDDFDTHWFHKRLLAFVLFI